MELENVLRKLAEMEIINNAKDERILELEEMLTMKGITA